MATATVITPTTRGVCWAEQDETHASIFIHVAYVEQNRILYPDDRIEFDIADNPLKPGRKMGINVRWVGRVVARQVSSDERPNGQANERPNGQGSRS
jgi:cold shock CspA family protein